MVSLNHFVQPKTEHHVITFRSFNFFVFDFEALSNEN